MDTDPRNLKPPRPVVVRRPKWLIVLRLFAPTVPPLLGFAMVHTLSKMDPSSVSHSTRVLIFLSAFALLAWAIAGLVDIASGKHRKRRG